MPTRCFDRARAAAAAFQVPPEPPPWFLYGLPILIKDCHEVAGPAGGPVRQRHHFGARRRGVIMGLSESTLQFWGLPPLYLPTALGGGCVTEVCCARTGTC